MATGLDAVKTGLNAVKTAAQAAQATAVSTESARVQAANQAIQATVSALTGIINNFLDNTGAYVLVIPLPKKGLIAIASSPNDPSEMGSNLVQIPQQNILNQLSAIQADALRQSPSFNQIFSAQNLYIGGNAYFVKTVSEAVYDSGDANRPRFTQDSYWAYGVMIAGASDVASLLSTATFLEELLPLGDSANSMSPARSVTSVVPQSVRVGPSGRGRFPVIEWERVAQSSTLLSFDGATVVPFEYAIIRSTNFRAKTVTQARELFDNTELTEGMQGRYDSTVIKVAPYDGIINRYIDTGATDPDKTYYYHVAFRTRVENTSDSAVPPSNPQTTPTGDYVTERPPQVVNAYNQLSSCFEWRLPRSSRQMTESRMGTAPDWVRTPSVATMIPGLEAMLDYVSELLRTLGGASQGVTSQNNAYIEMLTNEVNQLTRKVNEINGYLSRLRSIFATPQTGVFVNVRTGQGNSGSFLSDLIMSFDDTTDPARPSFDNGDEYVLGAIILCTGPDPAPVLAAFALLQALFGDPSTDAALAGVNSINTNLTTVEQNLLNQLGTSDAGSVAFNTNMTPRPAGQGDASCD